jgi:hypothetical protein
VRLAAGLALRDEAGLGEDLLDDVARRLVLEGAHAARTV